MPLARNGSTYEENWQILFYNRSALSLCSPVFADIQLAYSTIHSESLPNTAKNRPLQISSSLIVYKTALARARISSKCICGRYADGYWREAVDL